MKKVLILLIVLIIVILLTVGGFYGYSYFEKQKEAKFLSENPQTKDAYALIVQREKEVKKDPTFYDGWMSLAFNWKGIGEVLKDEKYLWRSAKLYDEVIKRWGTKAYLPFLNQANVYIELEEYDKAENDLKIALEQDIGEQNLYIALADLYRLYMNKSKEDVMAVYEKGLVTVVSGGNLVNSYASYLNSVGEYEKALKYYKMLSQAYPNNTGYQNLIKELEIKVEPAKN
ncbi:MAG: hypothetical protein COU51_03915 [Parcubacteria group bacterium CG10_big_fil_rev_8_21_14_0_10_36_14]|nr:MAG: hypothetical protein COU51_03915 [Parcubacteria group bacterium CG10_big_fil_rev_8_21_14_0_10_36_14]